MEQMDLQVILENIKEQVGILRVKFDNLTPDLSKSIREEIDYTINEQQSVISYLQDEVNNLNALITRLEDQVKQQQQNILQILTYLFNNAPRSSDSSNKEEELSELTKVQELENDLIEAVSDNKMVKVEEETKLEEYVEEYNFAKLEDVENVNYPEEEKKPEQPVKKIKKEEKSSDDYSSRGLLF